MEESLRLAHRDDVPRLRALIVLSVHTLQTGCYSKEQRDAALGPVFGVDAQLINDGTYYVVEKAGEIIGCGGWSRKGALFGSNDGSRPAPELNPAMERARVRAFFVHPHWVRRGLGRAILSQCETAMLDGGFHSAELVATVAGEPLYAACGYREVERFEIPLKPGLGLPAVRMVKHLIQAPCEIRSDGAPVSGDD